MNLRDRILATDDLPRREVHVPEWDEEGTPCVLYVRMMTVRERDSFEQSMASPTGQVSLDNFRARLCVRCVVDADGQRVFADSDAEALGAKAAPAVARLSDIAMALNEMGESAVKAQQKN